MIDLNDIKYCKVLSKGKERLAKKYMSYCSECNGPRGYIFKAEDGKLCKKCTQPKQTAILIANKDKGIEASANLKRGKPSPRKGIKTGKPAWNRKIEDPLHKILRSRVSRRMRHALRGRGLSKNWIGIFEMLGFTAGQLKIHLESKFEPGMTWDNIGKWHIDHIKPDSWFEYSSKEDQAFKDCWCLDNLQPMWAKDNLSKGNRRVGK